MKGMRIIAGLILVLTFLSSFNIRSADFRDEFLQRINRVRTAGCDCGNTYMPPVEPLTWNEYLAKTAYFHADDMNENKYFSHTSLNGNKLKDRALAAGYKLSGYRSYTIGENIAWGQKTVKEVTDDWFKSKGHCKNLMNASFLEVGVSRVSYFWVQDFGGRRK